MALVDVQQPESGEVGRDVGDDLPVVVSVRSMVLYGSWSSLVSHRIVVHLKTKAESDEGKNSMFLDKIPR